MRNKTFRRFFRIRYWKKKIQKLKIKYFVGIEKISFMSTKLVYLSNISSDNSSVLFPEKVAIHCHIFYIDLIEEFEGYLKNVPFPFALFVSVASEEAEREAFVHFSRITNVHKLEIKKVPNRGRDIAPFFCEFGKDLKNYQYIAHIQSKKSLYANGVADGWREYLLDILLGNSENISKIFKLFQDDATAGIVYPQSFHKLPYMAYSWLANKAKAHDLCKRLKIPASEGYFNYPAGSMFWARTQALMPLFNLGFKYEDFDLEKGQTDGTLAHTIERIIGILPEILGYNSIIIGDEKNISDYPSRIDQQYFYRDKKYFLDKIENKKIVAFDIFDTLLTRPLINPDNTKQILVESDLSNDERELYQIYRAEAERASRRKKTKDTDIDEIYQELLTLTKLPPERINNIKQREIAIEINSISPREEMVNLLKQCHILGKRIILVSDMFLNYDTIKEILIQNGITNWDKLYVSSREGVRKDTGELYKRILEEEKVLSSEILMIGDNERSDWQIPTDFFRMDSIHILKPINFLQLTESKKYIKIANDASGNLNDEITMGLILQDRFNKIYNNFQMLEEDEKAVGTSVLGPLIASYCGWLSGKVQDEDISDIYFIAREGKFLKKAFEVWNKNAHMKVKCHYLQVSRRAVTVPNVETIQDVYDIAKANHFAKNTLDIFLEERFGLVFSNLEWEKLCEGKIWKKENFVEIFNEDIRKIKPILEFLFPLIVENAQKEKKAMLSYLKQMGLMEPDQRNAFVDVGYSGTIQKNLNRLLNKESYGYYLATTEEISQCSQEKVKIEGCFVNNGRELFGGSKIYSKGFLLERILSSDDAQIIKYDLEGNKQIFKKLRTQELSGVKMRQKIQESAILYIENARKIKEELYPNFSPSCMISNLLFNNFCEEVEQRMGEDFCINHIVLDNDYCGRGISEI